MITFGIGCTITTPVVSLQRSVLIPHGHLCSFLWRHLKLQNPLDCQVLQLSEGDSLRVISAPTTQIPDEHLCSVNLAPDQYLRFPRELLVDPAEVIGHDHRGGRVGSKDVREEEVCAVGVRVHEAVDGDSHRARSGESSRRLGKGCESVDGGGRQWALGCAACDWEEYQRASRDDCEVIHSAE